jgi:small subunit ribosomal protein S6
LNAYEMTYIVRPDLDDEQTRAVIDGVASRVQTSGGEVIATVPWNPPRRRMAYPIKDFGDGFYVTTVFRIDAPALRPLENTLRLNDRILRFLLVQATETNIRQAQQRMQQASQPQPEPQPVRAPEPAAVAAPAATPATAASAPEQAVPTSETVAEQVPIVVAVEEAEPQPESAAVVEEES